MKSVTEESPTIEPGENTRIENSIGKKRFGWLVGLSGSLAAGLTLVTVAICVSQIIAFVAGMAGPGSFSVVGHVIAAVIVLATQWQADRRTGSLRQLWALTVIAEVGIALFFLWWH